MSYFIHSTEDEARLEASVDAALGIKQGELQFDKIEGHFGNEMRFAKARLTGKRASEVSVRILANLTKSARKTLMDRLEQSVDEHDAFYLRLDRQSMDGNLNISDEEPIRIKLKPKFRESRSRMIESYRKALA
ncbi:MAG: hypothetical protein M1368_03020 [Thaumarchaeota archaeon]|nr:hypothetical protein [Nitrososphaerota archaeon]